MEIFRKTGKMALGSRLRLFTARITEDAAKIYELYQVAFTPKWFPVFYIIAEGNPITITEIANEIGHSQPSVSKIVKEMTKAGLIKENQNSSDKRRTIVALTKMGKSISEKLEIQCSDIEAAIEDIISESKHNLWEALAEWEELLDKKSLLLRVEEQRRSRESIHTSLSDS